MTLQREISQKVYKNLVIDKIYLLSRANVSTMSDSNYDCRNDLTSYILENVTTAQQFNGFKIEDYISKGRFKSSTGRTGLGGYHVYEIVKGHKGYLNISSNKSWNVVVDILLPINNNFSDLPVYEEKCV